MADILLLEPGYSNKYPPIGLMKISYFHKYIHVRTFFLYKSVGALDKKTTKAIIEAIKNLDERKTRGLLAERFNKFKAKMIAQATEDEVTNLDSVHDYLVEHAPIYFSSSFKWGRTIEEKMRLSGYSIPKYHIYCICLMETCRMNWKRFWGIR